VFVTFNDIRRLFFDARQGFFLYGQ